MYIHVYVYAYKTHNDRLILMISEDWSLIPGISPLIQARLSKGPSGRLSLVGAVDAFGHELSVVNLRESQFLPPFYISICMYVM